MNIQWNRLFITGFIAGILVTAVAGGIKHRMSGSPQSREVLAELDGSRLTREEIRKTIAPQLIPVENDEYEVLNQGVTRWLNSKLIEKAAQSKGLSVPDFYTKEIWANVKVLPADVMQFYQQNASLYNQPFDNISTQLTQILREREYARLEGEILQKLREQYHAKVYLGKPESYVAGLGVAGILPSAPTGIGIPTPIAAPPAAAPSPAPAVVTFTDLDGKPSKGPKNAPITLVVFSDFHCPFCSRVNPTLDQLMKTYGEKIRMVWRDYPLPMHQGANRTHEAAQCAHEQGKFWEYHDKLFVDTSAPHDDASLIKYAEAVGVKDKKQFEQCLTSGKYKDYIQKEIEKGSQSGVQGTPSVFVNGQIVAGAYPVDYFTGIIDGILDPSKKKPLPSAAPSAPRPAPTNVQFDDLKGRPQEGPDNAKLTLVIFSDFHCPFCKRVEPTIDQIMQNYKGKVRKIWRHYPLPFHQGADRAAEASECAFEQKKFWEYHKALFDNLGNTKDDASLKNLAKQIGLDTKKFDSCLDSGKYKAVVQADTQKGNQVGVNGTPAVFVNGDLVSGAQPYESFDQIIKKKLA